MCLMFNPFWEGYFLVLTHQTLICGKSSLDGVGLFKLANKVAKGKNHLGREGPKTNPMSHLRKQILVFDALH